MSDRRGGLPLWEAVHGRQKGRCRECGKKVAGRRISWCSDACVEAHRLRTDPSFQRVAVFNRDRGVCAECGRDCVELRRVLLPLFAWPAGLRVSLLGIVTRLGGLPQWWREKNPRYNADGIEEAVALVNELGLLKQVGSRSSFWDMDHKRPLWDGGTNEIKNLRTLCVPCHRDVTAAGATQRASQRRQA